MITLTKGHPGVGCAFGPHNAVLGFGARDELGWEIGLCWECAVEIQAALSSPEDPVTRLLMAAIPGQAGELGCGEWWLEQAATIEALLRELRPLLETLDAPDNS